MPQAPIYNRSKNFVENAPTATDHPAINGELDRISASVNALRTNLAKIQNDDGTLKTTITPTSPPPPSTEPPPEPNPVPVDIPPAPTAQPLPVAVASSVVGALIFQDEFSGTSLNTDAWNDHIWYEASDSVINYEVSGSYLSIWPEYPFVNRTIDTDGKFAFKYGVVEVDAQLPIGKGCWPAIWLYGHYDNGNKSRPELDIMEAYPGGGTAGGWGTSDLHPNNYGATIHKASADYSYHVIPLARKLSDVSLSPDLSAASHKYSMKWTATEISFYFDTTLVGTWVNDGYFDQMMYFLLDLWFGSASGSPNTTDTPTGKGNAFKINSVRIWRLADGSTTVQTGLPMPA
jgi:hypothetical protein